MPNQSVDLDLVFKALADPTRRAVLERLSRGPASTSELARSFGMALPSFAQHLDALEASGLVTSDKTGRVRTWQLASRSLKAVSRWLDARRRFFEQRADRPDAASPAAKRKG